MAFVKIKVEMGSAEAWVRHKRDRFHFTLLASVPNIGQEP